MPKKADIQVSALVAQRQEWPTVRFGDIVQMVSERVDPAEAETDVYVGLEHLDPESLTIRQHGTPADVSGQKLRFYEGDIIFGKRRAYQRKLAVAHCDGICSAHAMVLRAKPKVVLPEFLPFFMQSDMFMERAVAISVGSLSPTINWKTMKAQTFPLPPLDEQRRIAQLLWAADEAVERHAELLEASRIALISIREAELEQGDINPKELKHFLDGITAGSSLVGANEPAQNDEYGVLKVSAVGQNGFDPDENKRILNQSEFIHGVAVRKHDLLVTRANTPDLIGRVCIVPEDYPTLMLSDKTLRLEPSCAVRSKLVLFEALRTYRARRKIMGFASGTGGAMKNISQADIRAIPVALPDKDGQERLHAIFQQMHLAHQVAHEHRDVAATFAKELREHFIGGNP